MTDNERQELEALRDFYAWSINNGHGVDSHLPGFASSDHYTADEVAERDRLIDAIDNAVRGSPRGPEPANG